MILKLGCLPSEGMGTVSRIHWGSDKLVHPLYGLNYHDATFAMHVRSPNKFKTKEVAGQEKLVSVQV